MTNISVMTFAPQTNFDNGSMDGYIEGGDSGFTWGDIRSSQTLQAFWNGRMELHAQVGPSDGDWRELRRGFVTFDTSALPDGAYVVKAMLGLTIERSTNSFEGGKDLELVVAGYPPSGSSDTIPPSTLPTFWSEMVDGPEYSRFGWEDLRFINESRLTVPLNQAGQSAISTKGWTGFSLLLSYDYDDWEPSSLARNVYRIYPHQVDSGYSPILEVHYIASQRSIGQEVVRRRFELPKEGIFTPTRFGARDPKDTLKTQVQDYLNEQPNFFLRSTTSGPESAVTADPGTLLIDLGPTSPSRLWIKTSGSGNTGWSRVRIDPHGSGYRSPFKVEQFNALEFE